MNIYFLKAFFCTFLLILNAVGLIAQQPTSREVTAKEGDGIYSILRENGLNPSYHMQMFLELNKERLGDNNSLLLGRNYLLPAVGDSQLTDKDSAVSKTVHSASDIALPVENSIEASDLEEKGLMMNVPYFGKEHANFKVKDQQLKGAVYYLLAGHGGPDPGALGQYGPHLLSEDEYAYDVTIRLAKRLMEHGATVYMIIQDENDGIREDNILLNDTDEVCFPNEPIPLNQKQRLRQRTNAVNKLYIGHKGAYQRMLSIHVDSRSKGENIDVYFYHHENSPSGKRLADNIHAKIKSKYDRHQPNRDYLGSVSSRSSLYVIKYSHPPAVFIELGNIKNEKDQRRFVIADNRQALANWLFEGMLVDYNVENR